MRLRSRKGRRPESGVRDFYEREGWVEVDGQLGEARRFGPRGHGALRLERDEVRAERTRELLAGHDRHSLVEFGGGGQPATWLLDGFRDYTGVDFSHAGLDVGAGVIESTGIDASFVEADVRALPLQSEQFDAGFSAHMIYHLPSREDQRTALTEMARVIRPGGVLGVVAANPYPWLFPGRCIRRLIADTPLLGAIADRLRPAPPLPYLPLSPRWMAGLLAEWGDTAVHPYDMGSVWFHQHVSETGLGRAVRRMLAYIEDTHPQLATRVGCFALVTLRKTCS